jgi:hypothetical protein
MGEGWLLSDGDVVASAVEPTSWSAALLPTRVDHTGGAATVVRPRGIVLTTQLTEPTSLLAVGVDGLVRSIRPLRAWRMVVVPRSTHLVVLLPTTDVERVRLEVGRHLEFRGGR